MYPPVMSGLPPMGLAGMSGVIPTQQPVMSAFPPDIMRPAPLGRRSPPRGNGGQAYSR